MPIDSAAFASSNVGASANYQGMWAVPNLAEAGWGINFTHQGDILFASWFTYDANGKPFWVSMTALLQSDGSYTGAIDQTSGSPYSALPYDPTQVTHSTVGTGRVTFSDSNNGTFSYTLNGISQVKPLARFVFAAPVPKPDKKDFKKVTPFTPEEERLYGKPAAKSPSPPPSPAPAPPASPSPSPSPSVTPPTAQ